MHICRHCKTREGTLCDSSKKEFLKKRKEWIVRKYFTCNPCNNKRARLYRKTKKGKLAYKRIAIQQYKSHPDKIKARMKVNYHLSVGNITKPALCELCNRKGLPLEGHHRDYTKPLEVLWYCRPCHNSV